jgi:hypothetical protein
LGCTWGFWLYQHCMDPGTWRFAATAAYVVDASRGALLDCCCSMQDALNAPTWFPEQS